MIFITNAAMDAIAEQLIAKKQSAIQLVVKKTGCSGYSFMLQFTNDLSKLKKVETDVQQEVIYAKPEDHIFLENLVLDYKVTQFEKGFDFSLPTAKNVCGCGKSFQL